VKKQPPRQIFEKLVKENAIKRKIGVPPLAIFPETLDPPPRNFGKNIPYPLPWIFNPCASMNQRRPTEMIETAVYRIIQKGP
jgi:hypothetical protein